MLHCPNIRNRTTTRTHPLFKRRWFSQHLALRSIPNGDGTGREDARHLAASAPRIKVASAISEAEAAQAAQAAQSASEAPKEAEAKAASPAKASPKAAKPLSSIGFFFYRGVGPRGRVGVESFPFKSAVKQGGLFVRCHGNSEARCVAWQNLERGKGDGSFRACGILAKPGASHRCPFWCLGVDATGLDGLIPFTRASFFQKDTNALCL